MTSRINDIYEIMSGSAYDRDGNVVCKVVKRRKDQTPQDMLDAGYTKLENFGSDSWVQSNL